MYALHIVHTSLGYGVVVSEATEASMSMAVQLNTIKSQERYSNVYSYA